MAIGLLQCEQLLLKHRVVQIQPDGAFRLRHCRGASGFHPDRHPLVGGWRTRSSQPAGLPRQRVRATSAHCLESLWRCERSRHPARALPPEHGGRMERGSHGQKGRRHSGYRNFRAAPMAELVWAPRQGQAVHAIPPYSSSSEIRARSRAAKTVIQP